MCAAMSPKGKNISKPVAASSTFVIFFGITLEKAKVVFVILRRMTGEMVCMGDGEEINCPR